MRRTLRRCSAVLLATIVAVGSIVAAFPAAAEVDVETGTSKEAWFRRALVGGEEDPACSSPAGCPFEPAAPADPYPEDTLHVGAIGGRQESATFLTFPLSGGPPDARPTGGTVFLPVASEGSGTSRPEAATIVACLTVEPYAAAQGGEPGDAPALDCGMSVEAVYEADADPARFTVDLAPFLARWSADVRNHGIGLVTAKETQETWHVAFSATGREGDVVPPPTAVLTYPGGASDGGGELPGSGGSAGLFDDTEPASEPSAGSGTSQPSDPGPAFAEPPPLANAPPPVTAPQRQEPDPVAAPPAAPSAPTDAAPIAARQPAGYAYPAAWLLPLALLLGAGSLIRTLRTDVAVLTSEDQRDLIGRLWLAFFPDGDRGVN